MAAPRSCRRLSTLTVLFPHDSWQIQTAKIINSGQTLLLWDQYQNQDNGWVDLKPLTIIFMPDQTVTDRKERLRHAVVMDVAEGANLRFDRPLDLKEGGLGRLIEGKLRGPVTIRSQGKRRGPSRRLVRGHPRRRSHRTADHHAQRRRFPLGSSLGPRAADGDQALAAPGPRVADRDGPNIGGIEQFQLEHVERLHLDMGSTAGATAAGTSAAAAQPWVRSPPHSGPVEITCRGPFCFNLVEVEQVATFRDQVDVLRIQSRRPLRPPELRVAFDLLHAAGPAARRGAAAKEGRAGLRSQACPHRGPGHAHHAHRAAGSSASPRRAIAMQNDERPDRRADLSGRRAGGDRCRRTPTRSTRQAFAIRRDRRITRGSFNCSPRGPAGCGAKWPTGRASSLKPIGGRSWRAGPRTRTR